MKKCFLFLVSIMVINAISSCSGSSQGSMQGQYTGEIYLENTMGAYLILSLNDKDSCALTSLFYDSDGTFSTQRGQWKQEGKDITLVFDTCTIKASVADTNKLEIVAFGRKGYLEKETPYTISDFVGKYHLSGVEGEGGFKQVLTIEDAGNNNLVVSFSSTDSKDKSLFIHKGKIVNNQIELSLKEVNEQMNSTMVIRFEAKNEINVSTSDFEQRYDLQYFCKGGGSLAGLYIKE